MLTDGRDGVVVPPGDPAALAGALARLLEHDELRAAIGERARARAGDFDLVHAVRRAEEVYRLAVQRPGAHVGAGRRRTGA